jgi:uncharacterized protein (TIGR02453 family)
MTYFTSAYLEFFKDLAANNHKEWFDANRVIYIKEVKEPFKRFVDDLISESAKIDSEISITSKEAIFRVNRDVRFSKDKTPYKLRMSAIISKYGRKDKSYPGLYVELGPEKLGVYGGLFGPSTQELTKVRSHIVDNFTQFNGLVSDKDFKPLFGDIKGQKNKRLHKDFTDKAQEQDLLFNKQWYYTASLSPDLIITDKLLPTIITHFRAMQGLNKFFKDALNT